MSCISNQFKLLSEERNRYATLPATNAVLNNTVHTICRIIVAEQAKHSFKIEHPKRARLVRHWTVVSPI